MQNVHDALLCEITRVQNLIKLYETIPLGYLAVLLMQEEICRAQKAISDGDTVTMITSLRDLKLFKE